MVHHGYFNTVWKFSEFWGWILTSECKTHAFQHGPFLTGIAQQFQNGGRWRLTKCIEPWKYVSISFYFEFFFKHCMQNYSTMSREHSGMKLLPSTEEILQNSHFKLQISEPCGLQIFLFSVVISLLLKIWRMIGKPNCCLTSIKLSAFLTMFMLNFVTLTIPVLFR